MYFKEIAKFAQTIFQFTCSYFDCIWKFRVHVKRRAWRKFLWVQQVGLKAILDTIGSIGVRICVDISFLWDWERRLIVCPVSGIHMFWHSNYSWDLVLQSSIFSATALFLLRLSRRLKTSSVWRRENWKAERKFTSGSFFFNAAAHCGHWSYFLLLPQLGVLSKELGGRWKIRNPPLRTSTGFLPMSVLGSPERR